MTKQSQLEGGMAPPAGIPSSVDEEWESLRRIKDPDGDSIEFDIVNDEVLDIAIKQGPHEVCRLGLTGGQLDVLIDRLQRIRPRVK